MDDLQPRWFRRLDPRRLADEANQGFVGLAYYFERLISPGRPSRRDRARDGRHLGDSRKPRGVASIDRRFHEALVARIDRILRRSAPAKEGAAQGRGEGAAGMSPDDETAQLMIRKLFHHEAEHRLSAAKWIREYGFEEAIPALEGTLSIEESEEVRDEIAHGLRELRIAKP